MSSMGNMKKYLIIDGSAVLHRAFHALPMFTSRAGIPTNAVYGFIKMTLSLVNQLQPDFLSIASDTPVPTFRKKLMPNYQAQRPKVADEFKVQIPLVQEFLKLSQIGNYLKEGFEADDVISTLSKLSREESPDLFVYILTGDKDILQLVEKNTMIVMPKKGVSSLYYMDEEAVVKKLGISPMQVVDYKALVGDPSDNYPGIKGIGPKTATKLLAKYKTLENIYQHQQELDLSLQQKLIDFEKEALLSKKLAKLVDNVEIDFSLKDNIVNNLNLTPELKAFLSKYSLNSIEKQIMKEIRGQKESSVDKSDQNQLSFF